MASGCAGAPDLGDPSGSDSTETVGPESAGPVREAIPRGRLPDDVKPRHYRLSLRIDPSTERFSGEVEIDVRLAKPRREMWIHGEGLDVKTSSAVLADGRVLDLGYEQVTPDGVVRLSLPEPIPAQDLRLRIVYEAPFDQTLRGLYRVRDGDHDYAFTQFQSIYARRAFPGFDEPGVKTPFQIEVVVPASMLAATATPVREAHRIGDGEYRRFIFEETQPLPTYLVAFAVGDFDVLETRLEPNAVRDRELLLRGLAAKGKGEQLAYALKTAGPMLEALEDYFGTPHPYKKIDLVAVPDFQAGGMENVGLITFREWLLLVDPKTASQEQLRAYANVMAHELAHQWFGNLVTMAWWDDLWLNEAFATWMGTRTVEQWRPDYRLGLRLLNGAQGAMRLDRLVSTRSIRQPIESNHDISNAFDSITYRKGGSVLSMFERYLGEEPFRRAIRFHLARFAHGSATAADFIESVSKSSGQDVRAAFRSFLTQPGVPLVEAEVDCEGQAPEVRLTQSRSLPLGSRGESDRSWVLPVCLRYQADQGEAEPALECILMEEKEARAPLSSGCPRWLMPNADAAGYYQFSLETSLHRRLVAASGEGKLSAEEKIAFIDSLGASFRSGRLPAPEYVRALEALARDRDGAVVTKVVDALSELNRDFVSERAREAFRLRVRRLFQSRVAQLGFRNRGDESDDVRGLRRELLEFQLFDARAPRLRRRAARAGAALVGREGRLRIRPELSDVAHLLLGAAVQMKPETVVDPLLTRLRVSNDASERTVLVRALVRADSSALRNRLRDLILEEGAFRKNERLSAWFELSRTPELSLETWSWLEENFASVVDAVGKNVAGFLPLLFSRLCTSPEPIGLEAFLRERVEELRGGPRNLEVALETIQLCQAQKAALEPSVDDVYLGRRAARAGSPGLRTADRTRFREAGPPGSSPQ